MTREQIQEYTMRISSANQTGLLVVLYEICMSHIEDAKNAEDYEGFRDSLKKARNSVRLLKDTLNFEYAISDNMANLYRYLDWELSMAIVKKSGENLDAMKRVVGNLHDAFEKIAAEDHSAALMQNTEQVFTGLTYGKSSRYETTVDSASGNRGYLA